MITIPVGINHSGIPFGIGLIHSAYQEHLLVRYGSAIGDLIESRVRPSFLNLDADNYTYIGAPPER